MFRQLNKSIILSTLKYARFQSVDAEVIVKNVSQTKVFSPDLVKSTVNDYLSLGFDETYLQKNDTNKLSDHVYGYLCALAEEKAGNMFEYSSEKDQSSFYFCDSSHKSQMVALQKIERFIAAHQKLIKTHAISVHSYHATKNKSVLFMVEFEPFRNVEPSKEIAKHGFPTLEMVSTDAFIKKPSELAKARYEALLKKLHTSINLAEYMVSEKSPGEFVLSIAFKADRPAYFGALTAIMKEIPSISISKKFMESFSNGVQIYTCYCTGATQAEFEAKADLICQLPNRPRNAITRLLNTGLITAEESVYCNSLIIFSFYFTPPAKSEDYSRLRAELAKEPIALNRLNSLRNSLSQEIKSERNLGDIIANNYLFIKEMFNDFKKGSTPEYRKMIEDKILSVYANDPHTQTILQSFLCFNASVVKHNFFKSHKAAVCFRLDPEVFISGLEFPRIPHGIFMFVGPHWRGFHVRFTDIARGGVRMVISDAKSYKNNEITLFQENYNLAYTQMLKNKDIPEGGSKGTILISPSALSRLDENDKLNFFQQYVDALQDVILPNQQGVVDNLKQNEIIFLGPDENTAGHYPVVAALQAKERGYAWWKCFTTGKEPTYGGIPHDVYGMTTLSVRQCVNGFYRKLGLDPTKLTKFQTGGPDGDLGCNEILQGNEINIAIVDGSGVLYDPEGIDRNELVRLAKKRAMVKEFDLKKMSKKGFFVPADKQRDDKGNDPVILPDGTKVFRTVEFRDQFHFSKYLKTDVFVPCGGRPKSINLDNVHKLIYNHPTITGEMMLRGLVPDIKPDDLKYKIIVEGANLFITNDARIALENCGVYLIKDATANKGGVTSSSIEVYTGLALDDKQFDELMCAKNGKLSQFYQDLVKDICTLIENKALREFELVWNTSIKNPKIPRTEITDLLSRKIVEIRTFISESNLFQDKVFARYILHCYTPKTLLSVVSVDEIMKRVPENYQKAICAMWLASDYVYSKGIQSNEFDFYEFMKEHREKAQKLS